MNRWLRRLRKLFAVAVLALLALLLSTSIAVRRSAAPHPGPTVRGADRGVEQRGFEFSKSVGGRTLFTVHAAESRQARPGEVAELRHVAIEFYGRGGHRDHVYGDSFLYDPQANTVRADGEVRMELEGSARAHVAPTSAHMADPHAVLITTRSLLFDLKTGVAATDSAIELRLPEAHGTARGVRYNLKDNSLTLRSGIRLVADFNADKRLAGAEIKARRAVLTQEPLVARLDGVEGRRPGETFRADTVRVLFGAQNAAERVIASGNVQRQRTDSRVSHSRRGQVEIALRRRRASGTPGRVARTVSGSGALTGDYFGTGTGPHGQLGSGFVHISHSSTALVLNAEYEDQNGAIAATGTYTAQINGSNLTYTDSTTSITGTFNGTGTFLSGTGTTHEGTFPGSVNLQGSHLTVTVHGPDGGTMSFAGDRVGCGDPLRMGTLVAGNGQSGFSGDGGAATAAMLEFPQSIALDTAGNLYIADPGTNRVRKVNATTGIITTVAGNGTNGFSGNGGPATAAALIAGGIDLDANGNLYIAAGNMVRKVNASTGVITTIAGGGSSLGDGGPATSAQFCNTSALALDSAGNIYVADFCGNRIRKINASNQIISTVAGNGTVGFSGDGGLATAAQINSVEGVRVDSAGNIYIADTSNGHVRKVNASTGIITTFAGTGSFGFSGDGGQATLAQMGDPKDVALDSAGNVYIADGNHRVRRVDTGGIISTVAQGSDPIALAVDSAGLVYFADDFGYVVRRISINNAVPTLSSLSPAGTVVATNTANVTLAGCGFAPLAQASFNGSPRTTTFTDSTTLVMQLTAPDLAAVGARSVTVTNPAPGGGTSNALSFLIAGAATESPVTAPPAVDSRTQTSASSSSAPVATMTPSCGSQSTAKGVWLKYTVPTAGTATIDLAGSNYQTLLSLWTGSPGSLTQVGCAEGSIAPTRAGGPPVFIAPKAQYTATPGQEIWILVTATNNDGGTVQVLPSFVASSPVPPSNYGSIMPHIVTGGGYVTKLTIVNMAGTPNNISVNFVDNSGTVLNSVTRRVGAGETMRVATAEADRNGPCCVTSWASISAEARVAVNLFYEIGDGSPQNNIVNTVGFNDDFGLTSFTIPVEFEPGTQVAPVGRTVGLALSNPTATQNTVTLKLRNTAGAQVGTDDVINLPPYGHTQRALNFDFQSALPNGNFVGTVTGTAPQPVNAVALGDDLGPFFATPPMVSGTHLIVPHMVTGNNGGAGYVTKLLLVNQSNASNTVQLAYFDQSGLQTNPFNLPTSVVIPANGAVRIATPEAQRFGNLVVQWARIDASASLGVNLFFEIQDNATARRVINTIGFNNAPELTDFAVPVELEPGTQATPVGRTVGLAMVNANGGAATVTLNLLNPNGTVLATRNKNVNPNSQLLISLNAEFAQVLPNGNFIGALSVHSDRPLAAIALEDDLGPFSAIPVIQGRP